MSETTDRQASDAVFDEAVKSEGLTFYGKAVLALLKDAPSSFQLSCDKHTVVQPGRLAKNSKVKAPRVAILKGLRELQTSGDVDVKIVTGAKQKNLTFAVRLLSPSEVFIRAVKAGN